MAGSWFDVLTEQLDGAVVIQLIGELDLAAGPVFEQRLAAALQSGAREVIVDLSGLDFVDAAGIHALARVHARADGRLRLLRGPPPVHRVFTITGYDAVLPFEARRETPA